MDSRLPYYAPLKSARSTRLLKILGRSPHNNSDLRAELTEINIDSLRRPRYDAISYTWGAEGNEGAILDQRPSDVDPSKSIPSSWSS